jgi:hypothetical protein
VPGQHDVRLQPAGVQGGQAGAQPLRVVRTRPQVQVAVGVVPDGLLGRRVRAEQVLGRPAGVVLDAVAGADALRHAAEAQPVDRRQIEHVAHLGVGPPEPVRLVERHGRRVADRLHPERRDALVGRPPGDRQQQCAAHALAARVGVHDQVDDPDVVHEQDVCLAEKPVTGRIRGDPAGPTLAGHGAVQVLAVPVDLPARVRRHVYLAGSIE